MKKKKALIMEPYEFNSDQAALDFYEAIIKKAKKPMGYKKVELIAVLHAYSNAPILVQALKSVGILKGIILKNSTANLHPEVKKFLKAHHFPVLNWGKQLIMNDGKKLIKKLNSLLSPKLPFVIYDHGGYFAYDSSIFDYYSPDRLLGVTEYAANGQDRYEKLNITDRPIISVGRSPIKFSADEESAKLLVYAAFSYMATHDCYLLDERNTIGLIGHGALGEIIAQTISMGGYYHLQINEINPLAITRLKGLRYVEKEALCANCNIIFCTTGHQALDPHHFKMLRNGTIIFTVTSADDELNLPELIEKGILKLNRVHDQTYEYIVNETGHKIYLPYNGESPTIAFASGLTDSHIYLPIAAHLLATVKLIQNQTSYTPGVTLLEEHDINFIAREYQKYFMRK
jgi:S-adenosylhomocysteine hydrolase